MKLLEISQLGFNRSKVLKTCKKLKSLGLDFRVVGGAAITIHTSITANDIDLFIMGDVENFLKTHSNLSFYDYAKDGNPRHIDIDGVPVQLIYHGDFERKIENRFLASSVDKIDGIEFLSLIDALETTTRNKIQDKLIQVIKALKLKEDWFKNLDRALWKDYAVAWDTVNDKSPDDIIRWREKFKQ